MLEYLVGLGAGFGIVGFILYVFSLVMAIKGTEHNIFAGLMLLFSIVLIGFAVSIFLGKISWFISAFLLAIGIFNLLKKRM